MIQPTKRPLKLHRHGRDFGGHQISHKIWTYEGHWPHDFSQILSPQHRFWLRTNTFSTADTSHIEVATAHHMQKWAKVYVDDVLTTWHLPVNSTIFVALFMRRLRACLVSIDWKPVTYKSCLFGCRWLISSLKVWVPREKGWLISFKHGWTNLKLISRGDL